MSNEEMDKRLDDAAQLLHDELGAIVLLPWPREHVADHIAFYRKNAWGYLCVAPPTDGHWRTSTPPEEIVYVPVFKDAS